MITELLQQPGSFTINLKAGTPLSVRESIPYSVSGVPFGHICVTGQRIVPQTITKAQVLAAARWTGRIQSRSNRMRSYSGHGLAVWLGDADNKGDYFLGFGGGAAQTMTTSVTALLATNGNGITLGSTAADTGNTKTMLAAFEVPIALLNEIADTSGNAWRINPDGTLDLGVASTLFVDPPTVILTAGEGGTDNNYNALYTPDLDVDEDFDDYATTASVTGQGATGAGTPAGAGITSPKDFGGTNDAVVRVLINASTSTTIACDNSGNSYLQFHKTTRRQVSGSIQEVIDPRQYMEPGDQLYLYEPEAGLFDVANQIPVLGQVLFPTTAMLRGITWPVIEGMGVYTIQTQDGSNTVVDLTDWIDWESGSTQLELGAPRRAAAQPAVNAYGSRTA